MDGNPSVGIRGLSFRTHDRKMEVESIRSRGWLQSLCSHPKLFSKTQDGNETEAFELPSRSNMLHVHDNGDFKNVSSI